MTKRFSNSMLGVTLLEIMLVLAIAAMIIVMSVRYYQSASTSQQVNAALGQVQAITAAADSLAQSNGTYSGINNSEIKPLVPSNSLITPWGTAITVSPGTTGAQYTVVFSAMPSAVCPLFKARVGANNHYDVTAISCGATGDQTYTYNANP